MNLPAFQAETAPHHPDQNLAEILDHVPEGIAAYDSGLNFTWINPQGAALLRCSPDALIGRNLRAVFPEAEDLALVQAHEHAARTRLPGEVIAYFPPGGCWLEWRLYPSEAGLSVLLRNVTERWRAETALRDRVKGLTILEKVGRLLESGTIVNLEHIGEAVTRLIAQAMQFPDAAVAEIEIDGQRFYSPPTAGSIPASQISSDILVNKHYRGRVISGYNSDLPFKIPEEQTILDSLAHMIGIWLERKQSEAALRESDARFRQLAGHIQEVFWIRDLQNSRMLYISPAYEWIWGRTCQALLGNPAEYLESIAPEDRPGYLNSLEKLSRGERVELEYRIQQNAGGLRWIWERSFPILNEAGQPVRSAGVATDITAIKAAQQDLEEWNRTLELHVQERTAQLRQSRDELSIANIELEKASRLKNEFLASMSHELRTPLTGILGLSEALLLDTYGILNERQQKALANIEKSGRHLLDLINDILDLSRIEAGKLDLQFSICSAAEIAQSSLQLIMGMAQQKNQQVGFSINSNAILLRADARRLKQMLVNLLSNAVKFTPDHGELGLEIAGDEANQVARFTVWDHGIGIKPEDRARLFQAFVQIDSSLARQYSGTGLGLALVKRMAELHGGRVELESVPGTGSRFTIVLPWVTTGRVPGDTLVLQPHVQKTKDTLTIEDHPLDAENVTRYLNALGVVNHVYPQAKGAGAKAAALQPGIIILNLSLPDGSGFEVLTDLHSNPRTQAIPVIVTAVEDHRAEAAALGAAGYLGKPFSMLDLHGEIARVAANNQADDTQKADHGSR